MSGYNRSCSRADSSILLAAQCAAALSIMPASAPSAGRRGLQLRHTMNMPFGFFLRVGFYGRDQMEALSSCQRILSLPNNLFTTFGPLLACRLLVLWWLGYKNDAQF